MNSTLNPEKLTQLLNQSTRQLDQQTLSALGQARQNALKRQLAHAPAFALSTGNWTQRLLPHTTQQWLLALMLAAVVAGGAGYWQQHNQEQQLSELDVAILTDELPIEVFVD